jgi:glutamyl-tRNA synthetase
MDWGNAIVRSKTTDSSGTVTSLTMDLNLEGDFRTTKKKITWLAQPSDAHPLAPITLLDYDYLITKKKLEETDDVADFVTPVTEFREEAYADANVTMLQVGDIIQFERKGYYIFDGRSRGVDGERMEFILIPDGRAASVAKKAGTVAAVAPKTDGVYSLLLWSVTGFRLWSTHCCPCPAVWRSNGALPST